MAVGRAIEIAGGRQQLADAIKRELAAAQKKTTITRQAVQWWHSEGTFVHEDFWAPIERITDLRVTRVHLRPDIYGIDGWRIDLPYVPKSD